MLAQAARSPRASAMLPTRMNFLRPRDRYLLVEGLRLHVLDWGGDGRTPLLLLHGFTGHAHAWDTLSIALQPHVHVYALDARGHGDSTPADTYTAAAAFDNISGAVDQFGLTSCVLVGLSIGGSQRDVLRLQAAGAPPEAGRCRHRPGDQRACHGVLLGTSRARHV